jgi:hypothetical protein
MSGLHRRDLYFRICLHCFCCGVEGKASLGSSDLSRLTCPRFTCDSLLNLLHGIHLTYVCIASPYNSTVSLHENLLQIQLFLLVSRYGSSQD